MKYSNYSEIRGLVDSVKGLTGHEQSEWLFSIVKTLPLSSNVLEIGTNYGRVTTTLGLSCLGTDRRVFAVDWMLGGWCEREKEEKKNIYIPFVDNLVRTGAWEKIVPIPMCSTGGNSFINLGMDSAFSFIQTMGISFDLIYLDGDHSYSGVLKELCLYSTLLNVGGFICGDDVETYGVPFIQAWPNPDKFRLHDGLTAAQAVFEFFMDNSQYVPISGPGNQFGFKKIEGDQ